MKDSCVAFIFCGLWLLASSEYRIYQNRFLDRAEVRDESGKTKWYLRENSITGRTEIRTTDGRKTGEIRRNRFLDRLEVSDENGKKRWYLRENPWTQRIDIKTMDGQNAGEIRYNRFLDRTEMTIEEVK